MPAGVALEFPYLEPVDTLVEPRPRGRARTALTRDLSRRDRATVYDAWDQARAWTAHWLEDHGHATYPEAADAVYALARRGDTASEIYVRIRAALDAFDRAGIPTDVSAIDGVLTHSFGEVRPLECNFAAAYAAALADEVPDPQLAALIALAVVCRSPYFIRHANLRGLANDGSVIVGPWGGPWAIPPELRRFLATWHHQLAEIARGQATPLFPGNSHGRLGEPAIRRTLATLDAPGSLWEDPRDADIGAGDDGRALLHHLTARNLWPRHRQREQSQPA